MNPVALAALKLGLISPDMRAQFAQWGEVPDIDPVAVQNPAEVVELVERALQSDEDVATKVTSLELIQQYCATQRLGKLRLRLDSQEVEFDVVFGVTPFGDVILPWRSEDIRDVLLAAESALFWYVEDVEHRVHFRAVEESYYGDVKAFMLCTPATLYKKRVEHGDAS